MFRGDYVRARQSNGDDIPRISPLRIGTSIDYQKNAFFARLAYKGNSLLGDQQYGKKNLKFKKLNEEFAEKLKVLNRQALHAKNLGFIHPTTNKFISFDSGLPADFTKILNLLNKLSH